MKKKILLSLVALLTIFALSAGVAAIFIRKSTEELNHLVTLHAIEDLRQQLALTAQTVHSDASTAADPENRAQLDEFIARVIGLQAAAHDCRGCHHEPAMDRSLEAVGVLVDDYVVALSDFITAETGTVVRGELEREAESTGEQLFETAARMSLDASLLLRSRSAQTLASAARVERVILASMLAAVLLGGVVGLRLTAAISRPIGALLLATRQVRQGEFGFRIAEIEDTEFGELAEHFNAMTGELERSYDRLEQEVAEHRRTGEALRQSEGFLRTVFDSIQDPFLVFDRNSALVRVNEASARLEKRPFDALLGRDCYELFGITDREQCAVARTLDTGEPAHRETGLTTRDGTETWYDIFTYPMFGRYGEISNVIAYCRDVTARRTAEQALQQSNERFELATAGAKDGMWDWDIAADRLSLSGRWQSMLGREAEDLEGELATWLELVHPLDVDRLRQRLFAHLRGEVEHFQDEHRVQKADGNWLWVMSRGLAVRDGKGTAYRMAGSLTDISNRKVYEKQLLHHALHDPLTGLPNRPLVRDRLGQAAARAERRADSQFAVLFLDLDRFKVVNDTLGHQIGDQLLAAISRRLEGCVRSNDTVGRIGGDEFVVILDGIAHTDEAVQCAERIQSALRRQVLIEDHELTAQASIGIATSRVEHERPEDLLRFADIAMYGVKSRRRGGIQIYQERAEAATMNNLGLEAGLHFALRRDELRLHYQPIIAVDSRKIAGLEALIRWQHPDRGLLLPDEFLRLTEESGQIVEIGEWVLRESIHQLATLQRRFSTDPPLFMSVNVSTRQLAEAGFADLIASLLRETRVAPVTVQLEITESVLIDDPDATVGVLSALKRLGVGLCLDDFGTGYSSLGYLDRFPIGRLKIDSSFVSQMRSGEKAPEIVRTIIALAKSLRLELVAEGVESSSQLERVEDLGCEFAQGYLIAEPAEMDDIERLMELSIIVPPATRSEAHPSREA